MQSWPITLRNVNGKISLKMKKILKSKRSMFNSAMKNLRLLNKLQPMLKTNKTLTQKEMQLKVQRDQITDQRDLLLKDLLRESIKLNSLKLKRVALRLQ